MAENAFTLVRPRGPDLDIHALPARKTNRSTAPIEGNVQRALDSNGRPTVTTGPRTQGAITLNTRRPSAATLAKQARAGSGGGAK
ncbi:hypothetical protein [Acidovorax sp.]|uniref:hypothetical protein n=1 Tax=Acidovorax sp. TaxID=1872122 RepID=UPI0031DADA59